MLVGRSLACAFGLVLIRTKGGVSGGRLLEIGYYNIPRLRIRASI